MKYLKIISFYILGICFTGCSPSTTGENKNVCNCAIKEIVDIRRGTEKGNSTQSIEVGSKGELEAVVRKAVDAKISIYGSYANSSSKIEEVYSEILGANPKITQKANLYRVIACAYYEIVCQDKSLAEREKTAKLSEVVSGFEKNIRSILDEERTPSRRESKPSSTQNQPNKSKSESTVPKQEPNEKEGNTVPEDKKPPVTKKTPMDDTVNGVKITVTNCELIGNKLAVELLYENVSNEQSIWVRVNGTNHKIIEENGNTYKSSMHSIGNVEQVGNGGKLYELLRGTKVKSRMEFMVGDTNFSKLAVLEVYTNLSRNHKVYNIPVN
ncbi:MAG: hypothetical protein KDD01_18600 [Phaeodactylibacter sp.]|nr:hypothetical protein [Phaeodactylibacter sp.]